MQKFATQFDITKQIISLPTKTLGLTSAEKLLLIVLSHHFGKDEDGNFSCFPSRSTLAALAGCKESDVSKRTNKLQDLGYIRKEEREGKNTTYIFTDLPDLTDTVKAEVKERAQKHYNSCKSHKAVIVEEPKPTVVLEEPKTITPNPVNDYKQWSEYDETLAERTRKEREAKAARKEFVQDTLSDAEKERRASWTPYGSTPDSLPWGMDRDYREVNQNAMPEGGWDADDLPF